MEGNLSTPRPQATNKTNRRVQDPPQPVLDKPCVREASVVASARPSTNPAPWATAPGRSRAESAQAAVSWPLPGEASQQDDSSARARSSSVPSPCPSATETPSRYDPMEGYSATETPSRCDTMEGYFAVAMAAKASSRAPTGNRPPRLKKGRGARNFDQSFDRHLSPLPEKEEGTAGTRCVPELVERQPTSETSTSAVACSRAVTEGKKGVAGLAAEEQRTPLVAVAPPVCIRGPHACDDAPAATSNSAVPLVQTNVDRKLAAGPLNTPSQALKQHVQDARGACDANEVAKGEKVVLEGKSGGKRSLEYPLQIGVASPSPAPTDESHLVHQGNDTASLVTEPAARTLSNSPALVERLGKRREDDTDVGDACLSPTPAEALQQAGPVVAAAANELLSAGGVLGSVDDVRLHLPTELQEPARGGSMAGTTELQSPTGGGAATGAAEVAGAGDEGHDTAPPPGSMQVAKSEQMNGDSGAGGGSGDPPLKTPTSDVSAAAAEGLPRSPRVLLPPSGSQGPSYIPPALLPDQGAPLVLGSSPVQLSKQQASGGSTMETSKGAIERCAGGGSDDKGDGDELAVDGGAGASGSPLQTHGAGASAPSRGGSGDPARPPSQASAIMMGATVGAYVSLTGAAGAADHAIRADGVEVQAPLSPPSAEKEGVVHATELSARDGAPQGAADSAQQHPVSAGGQGQAATATIASTKTLRIDTVAVIKEKGLPRAETPSSDADEQSQCGCFAAMSRVFVRFGESVASLFSGI